MKIFYNIKSFWPGFIENTDAVTSNFFTTIFKNVFNDVTITFNIEEANLLCESVFGDSLLKYKNWDCSILYSGESYIFNNYLEYTLVLHNVDNQQNIINCPFYVPYLYCTQYDIKNINPRTDIAKNEIVAIISNGNGVERNKILEELEKHFKITYAGRYKNNIGYNLPFKYYSQEQIKFLNNYKFVVCCENSIVDTYVTEKICNGMLAQSIPIYLGTERVNEYFNKERFINTSNINYIDQIKELMNDDNKWLEMVNKPNTNKLRTIDDIINDIKSKLLV